MAAARGRRDAPSEAAAAAGYGSLAAFSRAFARAYGEPPSAFAASGRPVELEAPNGIHFHPPAGLLLPGTRPRRRGAELAEPLVAGHLARVRELLEAAAALPAEALERPLRPGFVAVWFEGEEASAAVMAERLVFTLEVWVAAMAGEPFPERGAGSCCARFERAAPAFERIARAIRDRDAWDDAFVDALCEPPQSFTYGGVLAHVAHYGAIRTHALAGVLAELGAEVSAATRSSGKPAARSELKKAPRRPSTRTMRLIPCRASASQRRRRAPRGREHLRRRARLAAAVDPLAATPQSVRVTAQAAARSTRSGRHDGPAGRARGRAPPGAAAALLARRAEASGWVVRARRRPRPLHVASVTGRRTSSGRRSAATCPSTPS